MDSPFKDLAASKELDRNAMAGVTGGIGQSNSFADVGSTALAFTGPQTNTEKPFTDNTQSADGGSNGIVDPFSQHQPQNTYTAYPDSYVYMGYFR